LLPQFEEQPPIPGFVDLVEVEPHQKLRVFEPKKFLDIKNFLKGALTFS